jgi:hypothetical protein
LVKELNGSSMGLFPSLPQIKNRILGKELNIGTFEARILSSPM